MKEDSRIDEILNALQHVGVVLEATNRLSGLADVTVIAQRAAHEMRAILGVPLASVGIHEGSDVIAMRGTSGARTEEFGRVRVPTGQGIGGKILVLRRPVSVFDYERDPQISHHFADLVSRREGLHGMAGVPLEYQGDVVGVLYAGNRDIGLIGDRALSLMMALAPSLATQIGGARVAETRARLTVEAERQRLGHELHDSVGQLLFGIGAAVKRIQENLPPEAGDLLSELRTIASQTSQAASVLRDALRALTPSFPGDALPVVARMDADAFAARSGVAIDCIVLGQPVDLPPETEAALLAVVREGLHNVEKHASASSVILTLGYDDEWVQVIVQDDGRGIGEWFEFDAVPRHGDQWGLTSLHQRIHRLGGSLHLIGNEDGGVTLRACVPMGRVLSD